MYYEDIGLYFHDTAFFNTENPIVRDELWQWQAADIGYAEEEIYIHLEFNVKNLAIDETELELAIENAFPGQNYGEDFYGEIDTGEREISGYADWETYRAVAAILESYLIDFTDKTK